MVADSYSSYLGYVDQGTGNNNNNWGDIADANFALFEKGIAGKSARTVTGGTLNLRSTAPPSGEHMLPEMMVIFSGTLTSDQIVEVPNISKVWLVYNGTSGSYTLKFKTPSGSASTAIPQGGWQWVACNGSDVCALVGLSSDDTGANLKVLPTVNSAAIVPVGGSMEHEGLTAPNGWVFKYGQALNRVTDALLFEAITITGTATKNGTTTLSSVSVDFRTYGIVGAYIEGTGINTGTTITAVAATTITLSQAASGSGSIDIRILPHGQGDGSGTFNVPDDRNRASIGRGDMGGTDAARIVSSSDFLSPNQLGYGGGSYVHTLTSAQMPSHNHTATDGGHSHGGTAASHTHQTNATGGLFFVTGTGSVRNDIAQATVAVGTSDSAGYTTGASGALALSVSTGTASISVGSTGSGSAHNNMQPSMVKNKIIFTGRYT
jgi:microcystin-dependent protein